MDFNETLELYKKKVDNALEVFFDSLEVDGIDEFGEQLIGDIREFTLRGGKRIRAILVIFGYKAFYGEDEEEILKAAIAVELMQSFLLVHDDIIDCDDKRRGKPTLHKLYENRFSDSASNPSKLGKDLAIVTGDIASVLGQRIIQDTDFDDFSKLRAIKIFNEAILKTCVGQALDIVSAYKSDLDESEIDSIHGLKTSTYTFEAPLMLGAAFAGADESDLQILKNFALPLGKAFQVHDDIIGVFGEEKKLGKPIGSDLREGKKTFLISRALENGNEKEKNFLKNINGDKEISEEEILKARKIIERTGSLDYSKEKTRGFVEEGLRNLNKLKINDEAKGFLEGLAVYMLDRKY